MESIRAKPRGTGLKTTSKRTSRPASRLISGLTAKSTLYRGLSYTFFNFATPVVFFVIFKWAGAKVAIGYAMGTSILQFLAHRFTRRPLSPFFLLSSGFVLFFGGVDLFLKTPTVFRLMPFFENLLAGTLLLVATLANLPLFEAFMMALPQWLRPEPGPETGSYLRRVGWVWIVYLFLKAGMFLYFSSQVDLGTLILLRSILGGGSLGLLILGEFIYRTHLLRPKL